MWAATELVISFSFSLSVPKACLDSHIIPLSLQFFCHLSLTMTFFISSVQFPVFEHITLGMQFQFSRKQWKMITVFPQTTSVRPLKASRVAISLHNVKWFWFPWKLFTEEVTFCNCASQHSCQLCRRGCQGWRILKLEERSTSMSKV